MRSRYGLKVLGLCAMVLGLMAISASGAQAAEWMVNGGATLGSLEPQVGGKLENNTGSLLSTINGLDLELLCSAGTFSGVKLKTGGTTTEGDIKFTGCVAYQVLLPSLVKDATKCEPHTTGQPVGTILTEPGKAQLGLHEGQAIVVIKPTNAAELFANVEMGELCAFGEEVPVIGLFAIKDCKGEAEKELVEHLVEEFKPLTDLWVINKNNMEHLASIDGSAFAFLEGAGHSGLKFSGLAQ